MGGVWPGRGAGAMLYSRGLHGHVPCSQLSSFSIPYVDQEMDIRTFFVTQDRERSPLIQSKEQQPRSRGCMGGHIINFVHASPPPPHQSPQPSTAMHTYVCNTITTYWRSIYYHYAHAYHDAHLPCILALQSSLYSTMIYKQMFC